MSKVFLCLSYRNNFKVFTIKNISTYDLVILLCSTYINKKLTCANFPLYFLCLFYLNNFNISIDDLVILICPTYINKKSHVQILSSSNGASLPTILGQSVGLSVEKMSKIVKKDVLRRFGPCRPYYEGGEEE